MAADDDLARCHDARHHNGTRHDDADPAEDNESQAKAHCPGDTVVWVNTKSHVYHFAGSKDFGNTKHGGFMCRADADRAGTFHAAKNELRMQGTTNRTSIDRSMTPRFSGSSTSRY